MRRALVLTSEQCRHPFRQSLPPHVLRVAAADQAAARSPRVAQSDDSDWKLFCLSFVAFFTLAYGFIA